MKNYKNFFVILLIMVLYFPVYAQDIILSPYAEMQSGYKEDITSIAFSFDSRFLLAGDEDGNIQCWNMENRSSLLKIKMEDEIIFLSFLLNQDEFIGVDKGGVIGFYSITNGQMNNSIKCKSKPIAATLDALGQKIAVMTKSETIEIYDLKAKMPDGTIDAKNRTGDILFFGYNISGQQLFAINEDGTVFCWDPGRKKIVRELKLSGGEMHGSKSQLHSAARNRASSMFVTGLEEVALPKGGVESRRDLLRENTIIAYDWNTGFELKKIKTDYPVINICLGPGDDFVSVVNDENNNIDLIDLKKGNLVSSVTPDEKPKMLVVSEDNNYLVAGFENGKISAWRLEYRGAVSLTQTKVSQPGIEKTQKTDYSAKNIRRWAVIVGISKYKYSDKGINPLQFADADAKAFYDFLKSAQGGGFKESDMMLLTNEDATYANIRKGINSFLAKAVEEDIVIIYFAGHGSPDPNNPKNLFFITYDTDPAEMSSTGYLMDDLKSATNRFIKARNVLIFTDACHSAGVSGQYADRGKSEDAIINRYLLELATAESSNLIFTASEVNEYSKESTLWGDGHGIFTWSLLEGLKGAADANSDGIVTLGEIIDYTQEKVRRETQTQQHPTVGATKFDRNLPMSVIKGGVVK